MIGNCAKRVVTCTIVTPQGEHIIGKNWCSNPQNICPRNEYEDYEKCKTVCGQWGHAEAVAAVIAGPKAVGARAYVEGHSYACRSCQEALFSAGVKSVSVGKPEEPQRVGMVIPVRKMDF